MTQAGAGDLMPVLLLALLSCVGLVAGVFWGLVRGERRRREVAGGTPALPDTERETEATYGFPVAPPGWPGRWLAVRSVACGEVQRVLGLRGAVPCSWSAAWSEAPAFGLFVSPSISGWVLVFGMPLPDAAADVDVLFRFLTRFSASLGSEAQFFSVHPATGAHAWVRCDSGRVLRAYAWSGQTLWNQGPLTAEERSLRMVCLAYGESAAAASATPGLAACLENVDKVTALAARWSLDPTALHGELLPASPGIRGELRSLRIG
jgi:hypothetical protein